MFRLSCGILLESTRRKLTCQTRWAGVSTGCTNHTANSNLYMYCKSIMIVVFSKWYKRTFAHDKVGTLQQKKTCIRYSFGVLRMREIVLFWLFDMFCVYTHIWYLCVSSKEWPTWWCAFFISLLWNCSNVFVGTCCIPFLCPQTWSGLTQ